MKNFLKLAVLLLMVVLSATSCRDDDYDYEVRIVDEYQTKKLKKGYSWKVYTGPSYDLETTPYVDGKTYLGMLYKSEVVDGEEWYCLQKTKDFRENRYGRIWIPARNVEKCGQGEILFEVTSRAKMMEMAEQPIAHFILSTKEKIREKYPLDDYAVYIAALYSLLIWGIVVAIRVTRSVRVWQLVVTIIVSLLQYLILFTCDIYNISGRFDVLIIDLIAGLMWITAPIAQIWVMQALLSPILFGSDALCKDENDDVEDIYVPVKGHFFVTLISIIVLLACYHFNKDWVDGVIIFCAVVQVIAFLIMLAVTEGRFGRVALYMPLFVLLALPTVYISLNSLVMALAIFATLALLFGPIMGAEGKLSEAVSCKIMNAYGQEVDVVDSSGHSDKTGDNYDINSDGTARKK